MAINNYYALFFFRSSKFKSYTAKSKDLQTTILEGQKRKEKWQHKVDTKVFPKIMPVGSTPLPQ
jgi:hypothetical protein